MKIIIKSSQVKSSQVSSHAHSVDLTKAEAEGVSGFTLVELSIVIVIIGLIVAGITAGNSLVKTAKLQALITDINKIKSSIYSFRLQYNAVPGDMKNAYDYWGAAIGCTNQFVETNAAGCNGNGDGKWDASGSYGSSEPLRVWQHLSRANLWAANFDSAVPGTGTITVNRDLPQGALDKTAYFPEYTTGSGNNINHIRLVGVLGTLVGNYAAVKPTEGQMIDTKMDDGVANSGAVVANQGTDNAGAWYASSTCYVTTAWTLTETRKTCRIFFTMK